MNVLTTLLVTVLFFSLVFADANLALQVKEDSPFNSISVERSRDELNILFEEDFENGLGDWTTHDGTAPTEAWHLSSVGAFEGNSWWMGDEELGGYNCTRYIILDTPEITLPAASPTLTFKLNFAIEETAGADDPYDGWDGCNVRVSTDGGSNWEVITPTAPAYNATSLWSFGHPDQGFDEGPGIPGWGGSSSGWVDASFDLSAYAGESVKVRFAFASDGGYDTNDDPALFGMKVDNIDVAGVFSSDGEGAAGDDEMIPGVIGDIAGDFWVLSTDNAFDSDTSMNCPVEPNLANNLISPLIDLPSGDDIEILIDYYVYCDLLDSDGAGDNSLEDYYRVSVRSSEAPGWTMLHYAYNGNLLPSDWVYIDQEFALSNFGFHEGTCDISAYAGQSVQIKFEVRTDDNDDGGIGTGLFIDNVRFYNTVFQGPAPENLMIEPLANRTVKLDWDASVIGGGEGWIGWDDGTPVSSIGLTDPAEWKVASKFSETDMLPYVGGSITTVKFYPAEATANYIVKIWKGSNAAEEVASVEVTDVQIDAWNEIPIPSPVLIDLNEEYWIGYEIDQTEGGTFPASYDAGPTYNGLWAHLGAGWQDISADFNGNWLIQGLVVAEDGRAMPIVRNDRTLEGYNIWNSIVSGASYTLVGTIDPMDYPTFTHTTPTTHETNYYVVTAIYDGNDSAYSTEVSTFIMEASSIMGIYDDGSCEDGYNVGVGKNMAVKYTPDYNDEDYTLTHLYLYIEELGSAQTIIRVWDDSGTDGMPGTSTLAQFVVDPATLSVGWNTLYIPVSSYPALLFSEGSFYAGIFEMNGLSAIGLDTSGSGNSFTDASGSWEVVDGNIMLRCVMDEDIDVVGNESNNVPENMLSINNYPNPFNPTTTISMNIPVAGKATLNVYNAKGQLVNTLFDGQVDAGAKTVIWNGTDSNGNNVGSGIYFYTVKTGKSSVSKKMVLLK